MGKMTSVKTCVWLAPYLARKITSILVLVGFWERAAVALWRQAAHGTHDSIANQFGNE